MNKHRFLFVFFNLFYAADVGRSETEPHDAFAGVVFMFYTCSC